MDKPLNVVVLIGSRSVPEQLFRSALGEDSPHTALGRASGRAVKVSLLSWLPSTAQLDMASSHVVSPRRTPFLDRVLAALPWSAWSPCYGPHHPAGCCCHWAPRIRRGCTGGRYALTPPPWRCWPLPTFFWRQTCRLFGRPGTFSEQGRYPQPISACRQLRRSLRPGFGTPGRWADKQLRAGGV